MTKLQIKARSLARSLGITRLLQRIMPSRSYEEDLHNAILAGVRSGDVAWDVGANIGVYTAVFCERVGETGQVVAFEPATETFADLKQRVPACDWVRLEQIALGDFDGTGAFVISGSNTESHLITSDEMGAAVDVRSVPVMRGDTYRANGARIPNVIKIDVEGFEEEVLSGMSEMLLDPGVRAVFVEVHFRLLQERGQAEAPARIENFLKSKGFRTRWVDPSHIAAERG